MSAGKVYLAADVLLLPWNAAVMSVGRCCMGRGQSEEANDE